LKKGEGGGRKEIPGGRIGEKRKVRPVERDIII
jgi:hypothetical protein